MSKRKDRFGMNGCYRCLLCERSTRSTGQDNDDTMLCYECYEAAGYENWMSDSGETPERLAKWQEWINRCRAKGGKPSATKWWRPAAPWIPCQDQCGEFWCTLHQQHACDCECPPIEEWTTNPYQTPSGGDVAH